MPNLAPPPCLIQVYSDKPDQKGGTLIAEDVTTREKHHKRMLFPDGYRPEKCSSCGSDKLHGHGSRERRCANEVPPVEYFRRYKCVSCFAIWMVLAAFMARHLHRTWEVIQSAVTGNSELSGPKPKCRVRIPKRTLERWRFRLHCNGVILIQALAGSNALSGKQVANVSGASRAVLIESLVMDGVIRGDHKLAVLAAWIHRVVPGIRLM